MPNGFLWYNRKFQHSNLEKFVSVSEIYHMIQEPRFTFQWRKCGPRYTLKNAIYCQVHYWRHQTSEVYTVIAHSNPLFLFFQSTFQWVVILLLQAL